MRKLLDKVKPQSKRRDAPLDQSLKRLTEQTIVKSKKYRYSKEKVSVPEFEFERNQPK